MINKAAPLLVPIAKTSQSFPAIKQLSKTILTFSIGPACNLAELEKASALWEKTSWTINKITQEKQST